MKIVHILNSLTIGGREKIVIELCNELVNSEDVVIITLSDDNNILKDSLHPQITLVELPFKSNLIGVIKLWTLGFFLLKNKLKSINPDIIHNHLYYHFYLFLTLICIVGNTKAKSFRTIHTSGLYYKDKGILNKFRILIEKLATRLVNTYLVSISKSVFDNNVRHFKDYYQNNKLIPNGINFKSFENKNLRLNRSDFKLSDKDFIGVYLSRLDNGKNHKLVIEQIYDLKKEGYNVKFFFVGDGKLRNELEDLVALKKVEEQIFFIGYSKNISDYLSISDFAIFPSDFEGFPISLIEKMYFRLPIIASNIDIFEEIIQNNFNGFIFDLKNKNDLKKSIISLLDNKEIIDFIGENAYNTALKFNIKNVANETLNYYIKILR